MVAKKKKLARKELSEAVDLIFNFTKEPLCKLLSGVLNPTTLLPNFMLE
jgi:hypothetical protein